MKSYYVISGDTLYLIAKRFGVSVQDLSKTNNITVSDSLQIGQKLIISVDNDVYIQPDLEESVAREVKGWIYELNVDRKTYSRGKHMEFTFKKCNATSRNRILNYNTEQRFDIVVLRKGREVWRWSEDRYFDCCTGTKEYRPGQCRSYKATWDLRNKKGRYVASDEYTIRATDMAKELRNIYIDSEIVIDSDRQPDEQFCPKTNMIRNPSFEKWRDGSPRFWSGKNFYQTQDAHSGSYAVALGKNAQYQSDISQRLNARPKRIYEVTFWGMEKVRAGKQGEFVMEAEILVYDSSGRYISRVDPVFRPSSLPNNTFQEFTFTTGVLPTGTDQMELRFVFKPRSGNDNSVVIDDVKVTCVR